LKRISEKESVKTLFKLLLATALKIPYFKRTDLKQILCCEATVVVFDIAGFILTGMPHDRTTPEDVVRSKHIDLFWRKNK
jgi:hypothetical protein